MKKDSKQRLFEVMGKIDSSFKPQLNEFWMSSEKRNNQEKVEQAKQEILRSRIGATVFGQLPYEAPKQNIENLMRARLNLIKNDLPTVSELLPELFEPQGYVYAKYDMGGDKILDGFVLEKWKWVEDNDGIIRKYGGKDKLLKMLYEKRF